MNLNRHWAIEGSGLSMESGLIKNLLSGQGPEPFGHLSGKTGALFSRVTLDWFIKEEYIHDDYSLTHHDGRSIRTFSSGEQKKALLNHLLSKNPDFLVLENAFDMLDQASRGHLVSRLSELSRTMTLIQVFRRSENILPFITDVLRLKDDTIVFSGTPAAYRQRYSSETAVSLTGSVPPPLGETEPVDLPFIRFNKVSVRYGEKQILNTICWDIHQGDFWQLTGPNGAGKTTLLTMITGDNPKAYGQDLILFGRKKGSGESIWDIKKKIGYVTPAMTVLFNGSHTVESMVVSGLFDSIGLYKKPSSLQQDLAGQWIDLIGLGDAKNTWFSDLADEQQCMVLIARAMIKHPPLLILDEPAHGLTDRQVTVLTALVNTIAAQSRTTIIYVSHQKEKGLAPKKTYELIAGDKGSEGRVRAE
jgi:molybdate transport system ATP-binding protein